VYIPYIMLTLIVARDAGVEFIKAKFHYAILVTASWNLAYHALSSWLAAN